MCAATFLYFKILSVKVNLGALVGLMRKKHVYKSNQQKEINSRISIDITVFPFVLVDSYDTLSCCPYSSLLKLSKISSIMQFLVTRVVGSVDTIDDLGVSLYSWFQLFLWTFSHKHIRSRCGCQVVSTTSSYVMTAINSTLPSQKPAFSSIFSYFLTKGRVLRRGRGALGGWSDDNFCRPFSLFSFSFLFSIFLKTG